MAVNTAPVYTRDPEKMDRQIRENENIIPYFSLRYEEDKSKPLGPDGKFQVKAKEIVSFTIAGDKWNAPDRKVTDAIRARFPREYEAFLKGTTVQAGTPIVQLGDIDRMTIAKLQMFGVYTVESLASLHDAGIMNLGMGGRELQDRAKMFLRTNTQALAAAERDRAKAENEELKARLAALEAKTSEPNAGAKRRGRPPKSPTSTPSAAEAA